MQMSEAGEVVQVAGETAANQKLAQGWSLLAVVPSANSTGVAHVAYVLGKAKAAPVSPLMEQVQAAGGFQQVVK